ncbi:hypothetical protein M427DRAFT_58033 [Gonapodya prolifera JEL478]|uniref:Uncharacterized protein n=1 Tax=Gonapodya prolifera (strain JEL478) TaxID=1344416 RepID=A0A139AB55_GONPJ|nr:hypothetical protein M427DRAFT_58033 [Gonapodya prolifera JEL478]|eukprot:KXS14036.1 hypothetical protein M427DRAFT_58033 [Gonapodya prolifera JEL478]
MSRRTSLRAVRSASNTSYLGVLSRLGNIGSPPNKAPTMLSILLTAVSWSSLSKNARLPLIDSADRLADPFRPLTTSILHSREQNVSRTSDARVAESRRPAMGRERW